MKRKVGFKMNLLKLALLQIASGDSLEENLQKGLAVCREAKAKGADIALFPEMWSNGYRLHDRPVAQWQSEAIPVDGAFVSAFSDLAKELGMAICITLLEYFDPAPRNTAVLIDRFGKMQSIYAKVHTCDFDVERNLTPGDGFNAGGCDLQLSRRRAGLQPLAGPADMTVADGVVYVPELDHSRDTCLLQADEKEGVYLAELDLDQLRAYRQREVYGNAYRRPKLYNALIREEVQPPFIRANRR